MRRFVHAILTATLVCLAPGAIAAEKGMIIRAGELLSQPFIDAASAGKLTASQQVTIVERKGPWVSVQSGGKGGWVRLLNVRLEPSGPARPASSGKPSNVSSLSSMLQTGSSGRTVTTGVKGMDEEDIRNSTPNYSELTRLEELAVEADAARADAARMPVTARKVDYLGKGRGK